MIVHSTVQHRHRNVHDETHVGHGRVPTSLDVATSQQDGALVAEAGVFQGYVLGASGDGMLAHEGLGSEHSSRIVEPGQAVAVLRGALKRIDLIEPVLPTSQLNN